MPQYVIERRVDGVGDTPAQGLRELSAKSASVLRDLGPDIQWSHSYVTDDKIYCVYTAADADLVREHARAGGFPADVVTEVRAVIDPASATSGPLVRAGG